ncbi:unnamed protein product, partial [Candidula unifasciata]
NYNWKFPDFLNQAETQAAIHVKPTEYHEFCALFQDMAADFFDGVTKELSIIMENYK